MVGAWRCEVRAQVRSRTSACACDRWRLDSPWYRSIVPRWGFDPGECDELEDELAEGESGL